MIYLDSGATTLEKPPAVARAMAQAAGNVPICFDVNHLLG